MSKPDMREFVRPEVFVTDSDYVVLERLLEAPTTDKLGAQLLADELDRAVRVKDDPSGLFAKLGSIVAFWDPANGDLREVQLCLPQHADIAAGRVSVLAPVGASLLGMTVESRFQWIGADGRMRELQVVSIEDPKLVA